jgi:hypothetical protein
MGKQFIQTGAFSMKNKSKYFGIIALIAIMGFAVAACDLNDPDDNGGNGDNGDNGGNGANGGNGSNGGNGGDSSPATWTVEANGVNNTTTSTEITVKFNKQVTLLNESVVITGAASKSGSTLTPSGNNWVIPINVGDPGTAMVTISQTGIQAGSQPVAVHKQGVATPITWIAEQVGGSNNTANSTGIKITFSEAVAILTLTEVSISGAASKGISEPAGSGNEWTVPITVINQGLASVSITKSGVDANPQNIEVFRAAPSLNGKTWFIYEDEKIVFSASSYTKYGREREKELGNDYPEDENDWWWGDPILDGNGKYKWTVIFETGSYTPSGFTVTLTPLAFSSGYDGILMDRSQLELLYIEDFTEMCNYMINEMGWTLEDILDELGFPSNLTLEQAVNLYVSDMLDDEFAPKSYDYLFLDSAENYLLLQEKLPQSNGTWLTGEYNRINWDGFDFVKDINIIYTFTSGGLYTLTEYGIETETGSYVCVTSWGENQIILRPSTIIDGRTPFEYFAYIKENWGYYDDRYENEDAFYAYYTASRFRNVNYLYDTTDKVIGWWWEWEDDDSSASSASIKTISPSASQSRNIRQSRVMNK